MTGIPNLVSKLSKTRNVVASLTILASLSVCAGVPIRWTSSESSQASATPPMPRCANALAQQAVCVAANDRALELMEANHFEAFTLVQDVQTGALLAFAASRPSELDVTTPVLPLSLSKLLLSASWWDNEQPESTFDSYRGAADDRKPSERRVSIHQMLVGGSDNAGRQMARALRKAVGTETVLKDLKRYGFGPRSDSPIDNEFWSKLPTVWQTRLLPAPAYVSLSNNTKDPEWADTLSIGEANMRVTGLHISRFLQAVGNGGVMLSPAARQELALGFNSLRPRVLQAQLSSQVRIMRASTARRLQSGMREAVSRGTAKAITKALSDTGWQIGGKTGTGPGPAPIGAQ